MANGQEKDSNKKRSETRAEAAKDTVSEKNGFKEFFRVMIDGLYPKHFRCALCGNEMPKTAKFGLCSECQVKWNDGHRCEHCGKPLDNEAPYCEWCMHNTSLLTQVRSALVYTGAAASLVRNLKFGRKLYLMDTIDPIFQKFLSGLDWKIDYIVPVPLSRKKFNSRGFNQAALLAQSAATHFSTAQVVELIDKVKEIPHQARLGAAARYENVKDCFACNAKVDIGGRNVLLIDDVMTTGATLEECAHMLAPHRPKNIFAATLASGRQKVNLV